MKFPYYLIIAIVSACVAATAADAGTFRRGDGPTLIWVKIKALPGESRWGACRRVYQRDVYQVRRGSGHTMWCNIEHHRLYDGYNRRRNFNLR